MFLTRWLVPLFIVGVAPGTGAGQGTGEVGARVEAIVSEWVASPSDPAGLAPRLAALGPEAEPHLCGLLMVKRPGLPLEPVVTALGEVGSASAVDCLAGLLQSDSVPMRISTLQALGEIGVPAALPMLVPVLGDPVRGVRAAAGSAILGISEQNPSLDVIDQLDAARPSIVPKDHLGLTLGHLGTPGARRVLREMLSAWYDQQEVMAALSGLWVCGGEEDGEAVFELFSESVDLQVRRKACLVLGRLKARVAVRGLIDCLHSDHRGLALDAHWSLLQITGLSLDPDPVLWEIWWERAGRSARAVSTR